MEEAFEAPLRCCAVARCALAAQRTLLEIGGREACSLSAGTGDHRTGRTRDQPCAPKCGLTTKRWDEPTRFGSSRSVLRPERRLQPVTFVAGALELVHVSAGT